MKMPDSNLLIDIDFDSPCVVNDKREVGERRPRDKMVSEVGSIRSGSFSRLNNEFEPWYDEDYNLRTGCTMENELVVERSAVRNPANNFNMRGTRETYSAGPDVHVEGKLWKIVRPPLFYFAVVGLCL
jgi:hypothetical protein